VLAANGDTLFQNRAWDFEKVHTENHSECTLALKPMQNLPGMDWWNWARTRLVLSFKEKGVYKEGLINGGVYLLNANNFLQAEVCPKSFSFEKDYLQRFSSGKRFYGSIQERLFYRHRYSGRLCAGAERFSKAHARPFAS
jgi:D-glycero-alpha-D-manno-heptose 1-phosphate guanylyltransferase